MVCHKTLMIMSYPVLECTGSMSTFQPDENRATYQIRSFQPGMLKINELTFTSSMIVSPSVIMAWPVSAIDKLTREAFDEIITLQPDIVLIGTGASLTFPDIATYGHLINLGLGVEIMDTHAACRTYTVLSSEERNVVAALIV